MGETVYAEVPSRSNATPVDRTPWGLVVVKARWQTEVPGVRLERPSHKTRPQEAGSLMGLGEAESTKLLCRPCTAQDAQDAQDQRAPWLGDEQRSWDKQAPLPPMTSAGEPAGAGTRKGLWGFVRPAHRRIPHAPSQKSNVCD